ncbi:MAG TPA: hypothetical protein VEB21_11065 [Terriglobales bacterium]|nr:hypothetical protein [Terriglobales bacterium]
MIGLGRFSCNLATACIVAAALLLADIAQAGICGDDIGGQDVPCRCGDTVGSSVVLHDDPILLGPCPADGLVVHAPERELPMIIDLAGAVVRGAGAGSGIRVINGGGGVSIVSSRGMAQIENFRDGVSSRIGDAVDRIENIAVDGSGRDGIRLSGEFGVIHMVEVRRAGRDGFSLRGTGWLLQQVRAFDNGRFGFNVLGRAARLGSSERGPLAAGNGADGFFLMGWGHRLIDCLAANNGRDGIHLSGSGFVVDGCATNGNLGHPIAGTLRGSRFENIRADGVAQ